MTRLWESVLDTQIDVHNWLTSEAGMRFGAGWFETNAESAVHQHRPGSGHAAEDGARWAMQTGAMVFNAEPITVDMDMMAVVRAACEGFKPEPLVETDLITDNGFLVLPAPMSLTDIRGKTVTWRAAVWARIDDGKGIALCLFHSALDPDDYPVPEGRLVPQLIPTHVRRWDWGESLEDRVTDEYLAYMAEEVEAGRSTSITMTGSKTVHRQLQAIMRLLSQPMAVRSSERASRPFRRRAWKAGLTHENVTVVRLRRPAVPSDHDPEHRTVNWTHRWLVGGHWRNQWYPSLNLHRQVWISPFVKGPEDLPLVPRKGRIFTLVR